VIVSSFAVHQGKAVFKVLGDNMDSNPNLRVKMFLNVPRKPGSTSTAEVLLREFKSNFLKKEWPGKREPELFYDPRSLDYDSKKRSSLHAKCIIVDQSICFATSANMTEAAQLRNVEAGFIIRSTLVAKQLAAHFEVLVEKRHFARF
jgi:phosphatidylserine/phosphatidylglycerophosphate/cardiolipin synthase-like enzyme